MKTNFWYGQSMDKIVFTIIDKLKTAIKKNNQITNNQSIKTILNFIITENS